MSDLDVDLYTWVILPLLIFTVQVVDVTLGTYTLPSWLSGSCRDGWKDMGVWGGRSPPHTPNFLPLPAIPKEPVAYAATKVDSYLESIKNTRPPGSRLRSTPAFPGQRRWR